MTGGRASGLRRLLAAACLAAVAAGAKKKPLFEYDDHYVMLNDYGRNAFYRRALERVVPSCGSDCTVLDVGSGSGLLAMMAAKLGARQVVAIEANPSLAALAQQTIERNQAANYPGSSIVVFPNLSTAVNLTDMPAGRPADVLVTETFGTMLLGEGAINFIPDARTRLLRSGGTVIPAGGCQYATLIEIPAFAEALSPGAWGGLNLSAFDVLQDTIYWKATAGASQAPFRRLTDRTCILEVDLQRDTKEVVPESRIYRLPIVRSGTVHAVLYDWDIWADASRSDVLSTAPGARNFAGDVAWGWLLQFQEEADAAWHYGPAPKRMEVAAGELVDLGVEYIARAISIHARIRRAPSEPAAGADGEGAGQAGGPGLLGALPAVGSPPRIRGADRGDIVEANEFYLPVAGDKERHEFYVAALEAAVLRVKVANPNATVLDCSSGAGVPALLAAKRHGLRSLALARRGEFAKVLRRVAEDNAVRDLMEAYAADPRDMLEVLLPGSERVDILVLEPPGTPLHGLSPFAVLPSAKKHLLKPGGQVLPAGACFEVGLLESEDMAALFSVPGGRWEDVDLTVWNEEARRQGVLQRLTPYTKWLGHHSTMRRRWLASPRCMFAVDFATYGDVPATPEAVKEETLIMSATGRAHALVGRWVVWGDFAKRAPTLGPESSYLGRALTWPHYVQAVAAPGASAGVLEPVSVRSGETWALEVQVRQGAGKRTGAAGPEFSLRLLERLSEGHADTEL